MIRSRTLRVGQVVRWKWGTGYGYGRVSKVHVKPTVLRTKGTRIKRHGSPVKPVYTVTQASGARALKTAKQLTKSTKRLP